MVAYHGVKALLSSHWPGADVAQVFRNSPDAATLTNERRLWGRRLLANGKLNFAVDKPGQW